ncbi:MerC domain-containing protein [Chitinophaga sp.]|uniref:MerC domain-containing protein n=1 Tax=Chitinophaga sp. TaxID=1869181 RepID=UPI0031D9D328
MNKGWDAIGIGASLACAVHCVLLPLVFTTLTLFGVEFIENKYLEVLTIVVSMCAGSWALIRGYRSHHRLSLVLYFVIGLGLMIAGNFMHGHYAEILSKLAGAVLIITAHVRNISVCRH